MALIEESPWGQDLRAPILRILPSVSVNSLSPPLPSISLTLRYYFCFYFSVCMLVPVYVCRCACKFICVDVICVCHRVYVGQGATLSVGFHLPSCLEAGSLAGPFSAYHRLADPSSAYHRLACFSSAYHRLACPSTAYHRLACPYTSKHYFFFAFHLPVGALRLQMLKSLLLSFYLCSWDLNWSPHACTENTSQQFFPSLKKHPYA